MVDDKEFHKIHEDFTEKAYLNKGLLPDRYVFVLTNMCNLRCPFCFQRKEPLPNSMTADDWVNLAQQLPPYARVTLTGGEPLIFPGFDEVFSFTAERFPCNIITNGLMLTAEKIDFILSFPNLRVLSISIDDIGNTVRNVSPRQWQHLVSMLGYFKEKKAKLGHGCMLDIKTTVLDENAPELFGIYRYFAEELGADTHVFQLLKGSPIQHADNMFEFEDVLRTSNAPVYGKFEEIKNQLELVRKYNVDAKKSSFVHPKICSLTSPEPIGDISYINEARFSKEKYHQCKFPWSSVHINFDGNLFPCLAVSMGNVKEKPLKEIIEGERTSRFRELIVDNGTVEACNRCGWLRPK